MNELRQAFTRGARCGLMVGMSTLALSIGIGVIAITGATPVYAAFEPEESPAAAEAATDAAATAQVATAATTSAGTPTVERGSLAMTQEGAPALEEWDEAVEPDAPLPIATPTPTATVAVAPAAPPRIVPSGELYERLAEAFPEQPEVAHAVVMCESSGNASANTGNGYYGLWQFDLATWQYVGGAGLPSDASVDEQIMRARMLYERRGWAPWGCA